LAVAVAVQLREDAAGQVAEVAEAAQSAEEGGEEKEAGPAEREIQITLHGKTSRYHARR
jgi:hypothetical protein